MAPKAKTPPIPKSAPDAPSNRRNHQAAQTEPIETPVFDPDQVDYGDEADDRTAEEKQADEDLLQRTQQKMQAFLQAPPEVKAQLRTSSWKRCYQRDWTSKEHSPSNQPWKSASSKQSFAPTNQNYDWDETWGK